ncbi:hypothetical protein [Serratia fonticola]|uniref:Uncharacterized protein n=1 Tax=Serratia fonticola TaxID=47917 RepID=A0AAW3WKF3_SERFO|nr:hypothetical protein [Serratia fonticola]MBC3211363.1 hypothetical protein [Serratia fonticola]NYA12345.1 hypothetical protein [Serratia fonticola]NYA31924.1 hypothetical protein [Serratia fonticola]
MKLLSEIKTSIDYQQSDDNFINYLKILNMNGVIAFDVGDISRMGGELYASEHLYNHIISVYGDNTGHEEMKID